MTNSIERIGLIGTFAEADLDVSDGFNSFNSINWLDRDTALKIFIEARLDGETCKQALRIAECEVCQIVDCGE